VNNKLAKQTQRTAGIPNGLRTATIAAVSGTTITLSVNGGQFSGGVGVIGSYAPIVGDTVSVFRQDAAWLILGRAAVNVWHDFADAGYQNGWSDRGTNYPHGQWRLTGTEVQIIGQITNAGTPASGTAICTGLPAPPGEVGGIIGAQGTTRPSLHVDTAGTLRIYDLTTTGILQFSGSYPIDFNAS
jgi:hypothetical protein